MQVKSTAECSTEHSAILMTCIKGLSIQKPIFNTSEGLQVIQGAIMTVVGKKKWKQVMHDYDEDMEANEYGRNGGDPYKYIAGNKKLKQRK